MEEAAHSLFSASLSLLAGYIFIRCSYYRRFSAEHLQTDRFALHLLGYSFAAFVLGELLAVSLPRYELGIFTKMRTDLNGAGITPTVINSLTLAFLAAIIDNVRVRYLMRHDVAIITRGNVWDDLKIAAVARFVRKSNDSALRVIFRATILKKPLMVTLKSQKVYVGKPYLLLWDDPTTELTYLKILPSKSGFRDPITKKVTLSIRYDELSDRFVELDDVADNQEDITNPLGSDVLGLTNEAGDMIALVDIEDLGIVIAWAEVESLTIYDENLYTAFQAQSPISRLSDAEQELRQ